jgi:hypothetical protein
MVLARLTKEHDTVCLMVLQLLQEKTGPFGKRLLVQNGFYDMTVQNVAALKCNAPHTRTTLHQPSRQAVEKSADWALQQQNALGILQVLQCRVAAHWHQSGAQLGV